MAEMASLLDNVKQMCQLGISMPLQPVNMSHLQDKQGLSMNLQYLEGVIIMNHHVDGMPNPLLGATSHDQSLVDLVRRMNVIVGELVLTVKGSEMKTDLEGLIIGDVLQNLTYHHLGKLRNRLPKGCVVVSPTALWLTWARFCAGLRA